MNLPGEYLQDLSTKQPAACTVIWPNYSGYLPKQNHDRSSLFCVYTVCRVSDVSAQCIHTAHGDIWYTEYTIPAVVWLLCNQSKWQWKRLAFHFQSFIVLKKTNMQALWAWCVKNTAQLVLLACFFPDCYRPIVWQVEHMK